MNRNYIYILFIFCTAFGACSKKSGSDPIPVVTPTQPLVLNGITLNGALFQNNTTSVPVSPALRLSFSAPVSRSSAATEITLSQASGNNIPLSLSYASSDSTVIATPAQPLSYLTRYTLRISGQLKSTGGGTIQGANSWDFMTALDSSDKFPQISDTALLTLVQEQTFKYFWDFAHPVSGLARERNTSGDVVTSGGSGFGVMVLIAGVNRGFITRAQGLARMQTIVAFLKNTAQKFHGAFPHWLNGQTGAVVPFSAMDNGADLVETSYLMQGLLCARQYFNNSDPAEATLRSDINTLWNGVEWSWFRKPANEQVLYWHWSPNYDFGMNVPIRGWNECLITYMLAASSTTYGIPRSVYDAGWAQNGAMRNGASYYGYTLPLGPALGGPLFFSHYSFLGMNPNGLSDAYANYQTQVTNHTRINYEYCRAATSYGFSDQCWGLTASDVPNGYNASSPTNNVGVIAPTAALSSLPYTPVESMKALKFFYYKLGDKLWGPYGFYDAFSLSTPWFANSYLAIDQGPIVVMIENYRSGLLWNLFTSCPEVQNGMRSLGFSAPYL